MLRYLLVGILLVIVAGFIFSYNYIIALKNKVAEAMSSIDILLNRRIDIIQSMINDFKCNNLKEFEEFEWIRQMRKSGINSKSAEELADEELIISKTLHKLYEIIDSKQELKSGCDPKEYQKDVGMIETDIQKSRLYYNALVSEYNTAIEKFPGVFVAWIFDLYKKEYLKN
jgi:LemA protein